MRVNGNLVATNLLNAWTPLVGIAGTRSSNTVFTIPGDYTPIIRKGDKAKLTDTTTKYFYVVATPTFGGGNTTITIFGGTDYSLVGNPSNIYFSKAETPQGFPNVFNCEGVVWDLNTICHYGGGAPVKDYVKMKIQGQTCYFWAEYENYSSAQKVGTFRMVRFTLPASYPPLSRYYNRVAIGVIYLQCAPNGNDEPSVGMMASFEDNGFFGSYDITLTDGQALGEIGLSFNYPI